MLFIIIPYCSRALELPQPRPPMSALRSGIASRGDASWTGLAGSLACAASRQGPRIATVRTVSRRGAFVNARELKWSVTAESVGRLCEAGLLSEAVDALGVLVDGGRGVSKAVFYAVLKKCVGKRDLALGRKVHAIAVKKGYQSDTFLCNHILRMYAAHGRLQDAMDVFEVVEEPDAFMWSSIISAHVKHGRDMEAVELYNRMRRSGLEPDGHVFVAAIQACAKAGDLRSGQEVHADVLASGKEHDLFVGNCLVDMYAKCGSLEDAERVFSKLGHKDVVTWNALMAGYAQQGMGERALVLYGEMQQHGVAVPDCVTFVCLLQACASVGSSALGKGRQLHGEIRELGHEGDVYVGSSLVNMYAKCGSLEDAQGVFDGLGRKDVVVWTAMIAGYSQQGMGKEALVVYSAMQEEGIAVPNSVTFVCLLQACASVGVSALETGRQLHAQIRGRGRQVDVFVASSLVNMYAKCGSLENARRVFDGLEEKNVVTWTALIAGYAQQGMGQEALRLYSAMREEGITVPNSMTYLCLLQACANVADLHLGRQLHAEIEEQGLLADVFVAGSLIHMYGKSGSMVNARHVFDALPQRGIVAWNALIGGCTCQGESDMVFSLFQKMKQHGVVPDGITFLSVLTVCSHAGLVAKGREYFEAMSRDYGIAPTVEHYTCMVDLLGRAGQLEEAMAVVRTMAIPPNAAVWHTLLGACRKWGDVEVGRRAFDAALKLNRKDAAAYVLMSNVYTGAEMWEQAREMQARRIGLQAWKHPGQSWWTDMEGLVHSFLVRDKADLQRPARLKQVFPTSLSISHLEFHISNYKHGDHLRHSHTTMACVSRVEKRTIIL